MNKNGIRQHNGKLISSKSTAKLSNKMIEMKPLELQELMPHPDPPLEKEEHSIDINESNNGEGTIDERITKLTKDL